MNLRTFIAAAVLLLAPLGAMAAGPFTSLHPEEAHPDPTERSSQDPYTGFVSRVQEKLRAFGFDAGPVNGDFGAKTQAALAQFQLSRTIPASGQLDEQTLAELGVARDDANASAGASAEAPTPDAEHKPKPESGEKPGS
jgi:peptidoglycan hydrolase-like protein with peptidoglycan-binding domain